MILVLLNLCIIIKDHVRCCKLQSEENIQDPLPSNRPSFFQTIPPGIKTYYFFKRSWCLMGSQYWSSYKVARSMEGKDKQMRTFEVIEAKVSLQNLATCSTFSGFCQVHRQHVVWAGISPNQPITSTLVFPFKPYAVYNGLLLFTRHLFLFKKLVA